MHLFYECQYIINTVKSFSNIMLREELDDGRARLGCLSGVYDNVTAKESVFYVLTSIFLNYTLWQFRHKKTVPSLATLCHEVDYHFQTVTSCSNKIATLALASDSPICRRWREQGSPADRGYMFLGRGYLFWPWLFVPGRGYLFFSGKNRKKTDFRAYFNV